jgi:ADP-ribosylglycohydrolase
LFVAEYFCEKLVKTERRLNMQDRAQGLLLGSFIGDALALGVHWVYNTRVIDKKFGRVEAYIEPTVANYHRGKPKGAFTHYGDQTLVLLRSLAENGGFERFAFAEAWRSFFDGYQGYFDGATKETLENMQQGQNIADAGSGSDDLAGAARIAPLVYRYRDKPAKLAAFAREQTAVTHNHPLVIDSAEFFARAALLVLDGLPPTGALRQLAGGDFNRPPFAGWVAEGIDSASRDSRQAVSDFGQMCEIEAAFPAVVHLLARYESDFGEALVQNVMAGGDSAGRGLIVGMILGATESRLNTPAVWLDELNAHSAIVDCMRRLDEAISSEGRR